MIMFLVREKCILQIIIKDLSEDLRDVRLARCIIYAVLNVRVSWILSFDPISGINIIVLFLQQLESFNTLIRCFMLYHGRYKVLKKGLFFFSHENSVETYQSIECVGMDFDWSKTLWEVQIKLRTTWLLCNLYCSYIPVFASEDCGNFQMHFSDSVKKKKKKKESLINCSSYEKWKLQEDLHLIASGASELCVRIR